MNPYLNHLMRSRASALAVLAFIAGTAASMAAPTPPNIVFIMADDMGIGDPGCYNPQSKIPTPHMDKLAADGLRFTDAHTPAAVCTPTRYSVLTGRYCWRKKKKGVLGGYSPPLIENSRPSIASILKKQGYSTACIGKWHIGATFHDREGRQVTNEKDIDFTAPVTNGPNALGFDYAYWHSDCGTTAPPYGFIENEHFVSKSFTYQKMPHGDNGMVEEGWVTANADPILTDKACDFIRKSATSDKPFFLYLAPNAPHEPCVEEVVPEFARGKSKAGDRGDLVWLFDWIVGRVVETLESTGQADNTMIIVTSDNGALPGDFAQDENGRKMARPGRNWVFEDFGHKANGPFRGSKAHIWEGGHRVPFIVRWPGRIKPGLSSERIVGTDIYPTLLAAAGLPQRPAQHVDGLNLMPVLAEGAALPQRAIVCHNPHYTHAVGPFSSITLDGHKLIRFYNDDTGASLFYNLADDPQEQHDLAEKEPAVRRRLADWLARMLAEMDAEMPIPNPAYTGQPNPQGFDLKFSKDLADKKRRIFEERLEKAAQR